MQDEYGKIKFVKGYEEKISLQLYLVFENMIFLLGCICRKVFYYVYSMLLYVPSYMDTEDFSSSIVPIVIISRDIEEVKIHSISVC